MESKCAPVAVFTYNRPDHTERVLDALNVSALAPDTDIFIFCDNYKDESAKHNVQRVWDLVDQFAYKSRFKSVTINKSETNKGLATSIICGVSEIMVLYGRVIVVEDDLLASIHFLEYMNSALDFYKNNKHIWSISGYAFPMKALSNYPHDVFMAGRGSSWGWASWIDRWNRVDWDVKDYNTFKHNWSKRHAFARWGRDLPLMLDAQMTANHNSWAIRWCYSQFLENMMTVYPKISYIKNIGNDGTGTHKSLLVEKFDTEVECGECFECEFEDLTYDKIIRKEFQKKYSPTIIVRIKSLVKKFLVKLGVYTST